MENNEITVDLTEDTLAQDAGSTSGDGKKTAATDSISLDDLNSFLGKDFKDKETALEALKNTQSFVGAKKEKVTDELKKGGDVYTKQEVDDILFYQKNENLSEYKEVIDSYARANGMTAREASEAPALKGILENASQATSQVMRSQARTSPNNDVEKDRQSAIESGDPRQIADWVTKNVLKNSN